jgi:hypothetical protein
MAIIDSRYLGSFQSGIRLTTENPLEEIWSRLGLYGSNEYILENISNVRDKRAVADYVSARMRQSIELRKATRESTLLTAPLTLYYSVLNLTRAAIAAKADISDTKQHGLSFLEQSDVLSCRAAVTNTGTFIEYLRATGISPQRNVEISLRDCLSRIIEVGEDYSTVSDNPPHTTMVTVEAYRSGKTFFKFRSDLISGGDHFQSHWKTEYPSLVGSCDLAPPDGSCSLRIETAKEPKSLAEVSALCSELLEANLVPSAEPKWFIVRRDDPDLVWPRPAYYFAALFILSSIVRYQPELMVETVATNSKWVWLLRRFMSSAERFYPQLMFNWINDRVYFFG